ncbi:hypothetical protein BS47DRAFT_1338344, partial [Hydnum rufescens UP504]
MRSQALNVRSGATANYPRLHHSTIAQRASGKATSDMANLLDSLATSFDNELMDKERDLNQAHALLGNIQAEIAESQRAVLALKEQAANLSQAKQNLSKIEDEALAKMVSSYKLGWEKWIKEEDAKEMAWTTTNGFGGPLSMLEQTTAPHPPATFGEAEVSRFEELYKLDSIQTPEEIDNACEELRTQIAEYRAKREESFREYVKYQAEAGTGGRMSEYRRLIGAGCGGIPPMEVDSVAGLLLE